MYNTELSPGPAILASSSEPPSAVNPCQPTPSIQGLLSSHFTAQFHGLLLALAAKHQTNDSPIVSQTQLKQLASLREDLSEKQGFFQGNNILKNSKTSFYADDIGASLPEGIRLSRVEVFPIRVAENSRQMKKSYEQELIRLSGGAEWSTILNGWIKDLQVQDWVKQVRVLPYAEGKDGVGVFELELYVK